MSASAEQSPLIETVARALYAHSNPDGPEWDLAGPAQRKFKIDQAEVAVAATRNAILEQIDAEQAAAERLAGPTGSGRRTDQAHRRFGTL